VRSCSMTDAGRSMPVARIIALASDGNIRYLDPERDRWAGSEPRPSRRGECIVNGLEGGAGAEDAWRDQGVEL
jgi:hypothetical protein